MIEQTYFVQSQLKSIESQLSQAATTKEIGGLIGISASTLSMVNESMDVGAIMQMSKEYAKESEKTEMKSEMMADAMDMVGDPTLDENADEYYKQVLEEQALGINNEGIAVPKKELEEQKVEVEDDGDDLAARLAALKD